MGLIKSSMLPLGEPVQVNFLNTTAQESLNLPVGTMGVLLTVVDTGAGTVEISLDGTFNPLTTVTISGRTNAYPRSELIDLSKIMFDGSSAGSDFYVIYQLYKI